MRILYLLVFALIFWVLCSVLAATVLVQLLLWLFSNQPSARLVAFGRSLAAYMAQVVGYLTFAAELAPFPFNDWPKVPTHLGPDDLRNL
jgi:hypothetical protein